MSQNIVSFYSIQNSDLQNVGMIKKSFQRFEICHVTGKSMHYQIRYIVFFLYRLLCRLVIMAQNRLFDIGILMTWYFPILVLNKDYRIPTFTVLPRTPKDLCGSAPVTASIVMMDIHLQYLNTIRRILLSLSQNFVLELLEDKTGALWVDTRGGGLNRFNHKTQQFTRFIPTQARADAISDNIIWAIFIDSQQQLWIGTEHGG